MVAMKGLDRTIMLFPLSSWEKLRPQIRLADFRADREARLYQRTIYRGMEIVTPDSQGRIQLSPALREHAQIGKEPVVFLGLGEWIELWPEGKLERYGEYNREFGGSIEEMARRWDRGEGVARDTGPSVNPPDPRET